FHDNSQWLIHSYRIGSLVIKHPNPETVLDFSLYFLDIVLQCHRHGRSVLGWRLYIDRKAFLQYGFTCAVSEYGYPGLVLLEVREVFVKRLYSQWAKKYEYIVSNVS